MRKVRELLDIKVWNTPTIGSNSISVDEAEEGDVLLKEKDSRTQGKTLFCSRRAYHN